MSYTIFPRPKQLTEQDGSYAITYPLTVSLPEALADLEALLSETLECPATVSAAGAVSFTEDASLGQEAYRLTVDGQGVHIAYAARSGAYYALVTLGQLLHQTPDALSFCGIEDEPSLAVRGYMIDISRGKVPTLEDLCRQADRLAKMKYNQVQLYVEGFSFAYPSFPEVWKDVTPITGEEVQYFDAYCEARGIELVPNQNSLGHMSAWLARDEFKHLSEMRESDQGMAFMGNPMPASTLDAMDPASLDLVTAMMDDMMPFFHSDKFNVNLDEPFELGKGKNKALAEEKGEEYLYMDYLKRLHARVAERGKHMYMWGDILAIHPETFSQLPKGITVLDWGYEAFSPREFNSFHKEKMKELREEQKSVSNEIMSLRDQIQEYEFRIADITSVIKEETEIEKKIHEAADIDSYDTRLALLRSVETERQRIARELHDSTTQNLTAIVHKTELCSKIIESDPVKCKLELFSIGQTLRKIIEDTRGLIYDLRPMSFDDIGFDVTVERALDRFQRFHRIECGYYTEGTSYPINSVVQITLLRVIQEACNNAVKHAHASYLEVKVSYLEKKIVLVIKDDGKGFDVNAIPDETRDDNSGFGLSMMKERVYLLSGTISIESAPGKGCSIIVSIPKMKEDL